MSKIKKLIVMIACLCGAASARASQTHTDSQFREAGSFVFISSQIPMNFVTNEIPQDAEQQVIQVLDNLRDQVMQSGATMDDVIKITVYMTNIDELFPLVKKHIPYYFNSPFPARSPLGGVEFPKKSGFKLAIDAIVYKR